MEFEKRAMTLEEDKYTFHQSHQINGQTGLIGYLRADMDTNGTGFFSTWTDHCEHWKTQEFKEEFDKMINSLREEGDILHSRKDMAAYCYATPQSKMKEEGYYGVRVDSEKYAYLLRLNPNKGEYNLYCYCYRKDWLDDHIRAARKGIRFIDSHYNELFRIADGDKVREVYRDGDFKDKLCRYIDDYHVEIGENMYHICEYAERVERGNVKVIPLRASLPERCYIYLCTTNEIGIVVKGESGYYKTDIQGGTAEDLKALVKHYNSGLGVSDMQVRAMVFGSMFGWDVPGANPYAFADMRKPDVREAKLLASELLAFMKKYDFYDFCDYTDDEEKMLHSIAQDILTNQTDDYVNGLREIANDEEADADTRWLARQLAEQFEKNY